MTSEPPNDADRVRVLRLLGFGFFAAAVVLFVVLLVLSADWDPTDDELARLGAVIAGLTGAGGVAAAVWWRNRALAAPITPDRLLTSWIVAVAFAEVGMILGFVFAFLSRSLTPFLVGAAVFAVALAILTTVLGQVELEA